MPQFILKIDLNPATTCYEICRALDEVRDKIHGRSMREIKEQVWNHPLHDINGNIVGHYEVVPE